MFEVITKKQAIEEKRTKYFTGKPCRYGHITQRYVISAVCVSCAAYYSKGEKPLSNTKFRRSETFSVTVKDPGVKRLVLDFVQALNASTALEDSAAGVEYGKDGLLITNPFRNPA